MFFSRPAGHKYTNRGDPAVCDFDLTDFPAEDTWYDLNLSDIVPPNTKGVIITVKTVNSGAGGTMYFRKNGNSNVIEGDGVETQVALVKARANLIIGCDNNRIIEGFMSNLTFTSIEITVTGWFA